MKNCDLERAREIFDSGDYTCVLCKGEVTLTSTERGVKPLLNWLDGENVLKGFSAADKVRQMCLQNTESSLAMVFWQRKSLTVREMVSARWNRQ